MIRRTLPGVMAWQREHRRLVGLAFFAGGVAWDAATIVRVDRWAEQVGLLAYLVTLTALVVVESRHERTPAPVLDAAASGGAWVERWPVFVGWAIQFLVGGLFSAFLVLYTRSTTFGPRLLFLAALFALMVANELWQQRLRQVWLRLALVWFGWWAYTRMAIPVWTGWPGPGVSWVAGLTASAVVLTTAQVIVPGLRALRRGLGVVALCGVSVLGLEAGGLVPPAPFAVLEVAVVHDVVREETPEGLLYRLRYEKGRWPWQDDDRAFHQRDGESVHVFSAVYAPANLRLAVVHRWLVAGEGGWVQTDLIDVTPPTGTVGGRAGGYRTWSEKQHVRPGAWRVLVEDTRGREIGRVDFEVLSGPHPAPEWTERVWR